LPEAIMMRSVSLLFAILSLSQDALAASIVRVELNALQETGEKCRVIFLTENKVVLKLMS
jgi:hypothetical protein